MDCPRAELTSDTLRNLRRYYGLPQKYLATCLRISQTAYSKMERGCARVSEEHLRRIADVYGLPHLELQTKSSDEIIRGIIDGKPPPRTGRYHAGFAVKLLALLRSI